MNQPKNTFFIEQHTNDYILINDLSDETPSIPIADNAENVIKYLSLNFNIVNKKVLFRDSSDYVDELLHDNKGNFIGFKCG